MTRGQLRLGARATINVALVMVMVMVIINMMIISWSGDQRVGCEQEEASTGERI